MNLGVADAQGVLVGLSFWIFTISSGSRVEKVSFKSRLPNVFSSPSEIGSIDTKSMFEFALWNSTATTMIIKTIVARAITSFNFYSDFQANDHNDTENFSMGPFPESPA